MSLCRKVAFVVCLVVTGASAGAGGFDIFQGGDAAHAAWLTAAGGSAPLENFDAYAGGFGNGNQIAALPALGIVFDEMDPGFYPSVYFDPQWPHTQPNMICNFTNGVPFRDTIVLHPAPGKYITALGFWNSDPQGSQRAFAYDGSGNLMGILDGVTNPPGNFGAGCFAGFVSSTPIMRVEFPAEFGDGYQHWDDLQVVARDFVPGCLGDYNNDGIVNFDDVLFVLANFGSPYTFDDVLTVLANFGVVCV